MKCTGFMTLNDTSSLNMPQKLDRRNWATEERFRLGGAAELRTPVRAYLLDVDDALNPWMGTFYPECCVSPLCIYVEQMTHSRPNIFHDSHFQEWRSNSNMWKFEKTADRRFQSDSDVWCQRRPYWRLIGIRVHLLKLGGFEKRMIRLQGVETSVANLRDGYQ